MSETEPNNYIIENEFVIGDESKVFFGGESVTTLPATTSLCDILVNLGVFPSKSQARKNGYADWATSCPPGFNSFKVGKTKKDVTILNPTRYNKFPEEDPTKEYLETLTKFKK